MIIVFATDNYWPRTSGMAVSIETFKRELEKRGHEVHVICPDYPDASVSDGKTGRTNIHRFSSYELAFLLKTEDSMVHVFERNRVFETLDIIRPDLIHVQTEFTMGRFAIEYAGKRHVPLIITSHTHFEEYIKIYFPLIPEKFAAKYVRIKSKQIFNKADTLLVPTDAMRDLHLRNGVNVPIRIVPTGIDYDLFSNPEPELARSKIMKIHPSSLKRRSMLYAGRLGIEKNLHFLIDVVEKIKQEIPDIVLYIIGEGPVRNAMEYIIKQKGLTDNIFFLGYVSHKEIKNYFAFCDVFTFPSKTETQGLVTIESMVCGTPVVGIGEMGTKSVMQGDNGGFMVSDDLDEFAARTIQLLSDEKLYQAKCREAVEFSGRFKIEFITDRLEKIYFESRRSKRLKLFERLSNRKHEAGLLVQLRQSV